MRHAAGVRGVGDELAAGGLFAGGDVEQAKFRVEPAIAAALRAPRQHELRVNGLVDIEIGRLVGVDRRAADA